MRKMWQCDDNAAWYGFFIRRSKGRPVYPWHETARLSHDERRVVAHSIREFQLGESGSGEHFFRCALAYARRSGDDYYPAAQRVFVREEHRHSELLRRFLETQGIPLMQHHWVDDIFRQLRKCAGLEMSVMVLVTAEIIAKPFYRALRRATTNATLRALCTEILGDEGAHVIFQGVMLGKLRRGRHRFLRHLCEAAHYVLMAGAALVVWHEHRKVLQRGGFSLVSFLRECFLELTVLIARIAPARDIRRERDSRPELSTQSAR